ncbi:MAG: methyltransferase domain-containing protein [Halieaceae bacterium]
MTDLATLVPAVALQQLTLEEQVYLREIFDRFDGYPKLEQVWQLMDEQWVALGCDPEHMDDRVARFYRHPVWMLNGLFIEQHLLSMENRVAFTYWVVAHRPTRVADFGGGFGGLARLIGQALPDAQIEVVEPYPHAAAIAISEDAPNVRFVPKLTGDYDLLIATDVFEHVPDPLGLALETAEHLRVDGQYLIANCFQPVILCHLPQLFYFNMGWDSAMRALGLVPGDRVEYARAYRRLEKLDVAEARKVGDFARRLYPWFQYLPGHGKLIGEVLLGAFFGLRKS